MNKTFIHSSKADARKAAFDGGWNLDELLVSVDANGIWGWTLMDEPGFPADLIAPKQYRRADADPVEPEEQRVINPHSPVVFSPAVYEERVAEKPEVDEFIAEEGTEETVQQPDPEAVEEPEVASPVMPEASDTADGEDELREAEAGDVILQINGPMLPAAAKLRAMTYAKQLGLEITLRDALTLEIIEVVKGRKRRGADATDMVIDMCSRPEGATASELAVAAKEQGLALGKGGGEGAATRAQAKGYTLIVDAVFRGKKPVRAYFLRPNNDDDELPQAAE